MSIQEHLNKIRNAVYGHEVRESIAKGIETAYDDASENGNANMEVNIARGTHPTLRSRLDEVDNKQQQNTAQLAEAEVILSGIDKTFGDTTYATLGDLQTAYPTGDTKRYIVASDGKWYWWNGTAWIGGQVAQAIGIADSTLKYEHLTDELKQVYAEVETIVSDYNIKSAGNASTTFYGAGVFLKNTKKLLTKVVLTTKLKESATLTLEILGGTDPTYSSIATKSVFVDTAIDDLITAQGDVVFDLGYLDVSAYPTLCVRVLSNETAGISKISDPSNLNLSAIYTTRPNPYQFYNGASFSSTPDGAYAPCVSLEYLDVVDKHGNLSTINTLHVAKDGSGDFITVAEAVASTAGVANVSNVFDILIHDGVYEENSFVVPDYVNLIGYSGVKENCWIKGYLPPSSSDAQIAAASTIWIKGNTKLENLKITAQNMRYPVHSETSNTLKNWTQIVESCHIEHIGNAEVVAYRLANSLPAGSPWTSCHAWGEGNSSGTRSEFKNTLFKSVENGWYVHYNTNYEKPSLHIFDNCEFVTTTNNEACIYMSNTSAGLVNKVHINNSLITGNVKISGTGGNEMYISGSGIVPTMTETDNLNYAYVLNRNPIFTDYTHKYRVLDDTLTAGDIVYFSTINGVRRANETTPKGLIAGMVLGDYVKDDFAVVTSKKIWYYGGTTANGYLYKVVNGVLTRTTVLTDIIVAVGIGGGYIQLI